MFFVSVASKELRVYVSGLESTLARISISVDSKWVSDGRLGLELAGDKQYTKAALAYQGENTRPPEDPFCLSRLALSDGLSERRRESSRLSDRSRSACGSLPGPRLDSRR